jgi:hypothetical protein
LNRDFRDGNHSVAYHEVKMSNPVFSYTFRSNKFETIETAFNIPLRMICVSPTVSLRVKTAVLTTSRSENGCINYGGGASTFVHRVQAKGSSGQTIQVEQSLPISS